MMIGREGGGGGGGEQNQLEDKSSPVYLRSLTETLTCTWLHGYSCPRVNSAAPPPPSPPPSPIPCWWPHIYFQPPRFATVTRTLWC